MKDSSIHYTSQCQCGATRLTVRGRPLMRMICHCTICQAFNHAACADIALFRGKAVALADDGRVNFQTYRAPPALQRGTCAACGEPAIEHLLNITIVPVSMFADTSLLPTPSLHIFYDRRRFDANDALPKYSGYGSSQLAVGRHLLKAMFARERHR